MPASGVIAGIDIAARRHSYPGDGKVCPTDGLGAFIDTPCHFATDRRSDIFEGNNPTAGRVVIEGPFHVESRADAAN